MMDEELIIYGSCKKCPVGGAVLADALNVGNLDGQRFVFWIDTTTKEMVSYQRIEVDSPYVSEVWRRTR